MQGTTRFIAVLLVCLVFGGAWFSPVCAGTTSAATVHDVRMWRSPERTRLVFEVSGPVEHKVFVLQNPRRLVIDVENISFDTSLQKLDFSPTPIARLRRGVRNGRDLRIVLDLKEDITPRSFSLKPNDLYGDRLVVDLYDVAPATNKTVANIITTSHLNRDIIVAIDAGHGGEDPGSPGAVGVPEKKVVLEIAKALKEIVDAQPGFRGELTRKGDYYISVNERSALARKMRADLLVSVHADGFKNSRPRGASVYTQVQRRAAREKGRYLSDRDRREDLLGGVESVSIKDKDDMLAGVLLDLSMTAALSGSAEVAGEVLQSIRQIAMLHKKQVAQKSLGVLISPDMPSILVEAGFITNHKDARLLVKSSYQKKMARAIFSGINRYFDTHPPEGTWLAANQKQAGRTYVISRGDTLSEIAQRYNVSVRQLMSHNGLKNTRIKLGQRLKIPVP